MSASGSNSLPFSQSIAQSGAIDSSVLVAAQTNAITARGITMQFQSGEEQLWVLQGIDLDVAYGTIQVLMGPSGSGKNTLLSILAGILTPTAGQVYLLGQDITRFSKTQLAQFRLHHIGFIFQEFNLFPALTAIENVELALNLKGLTGTTARQQARQLLEQVNLSHKANSLPRNLSGGQKQLIAVARALAGNPELVMADEPTASLDSANGRIVVDLLRWLAKEKGQTVVMVTHDHRILDIADRISSLEDGSLR
jgi:putative ABC transport system ATP-binding protein